MYAAQDAAAFWRLFDTTGFYLVMFFAPSDHRAYEWYIIQKTLWAHRIKPPSDEGGGFAEGEDGGRDTPQFVSLPQSALQTAPSS